LVPRADQDQNQVYEVEAGIGTWNYSRNEFIIGKIKIKLSDLMGMIS
jgi:hypothetical protein